MYSKRQTRGEGIEKCLDEGLEPTYHSNIFNYLNETYVVCYTYDI